MSDNIRESKQPSKMPGKPPRGARVSMKFDRKTIKRMLSYMKPFTPQLILVLICILVTSGASVASSVFLKTLIDDFIMPLVENSKNGITPDYSGLFGALAGMAALFLAGAVSSLFYSRIMATVSQGVLKRIRDEMFSHMQSRR